MAVGHNRVEVVCKRPGGSVSRVLGQAFAQDRSGPARQRLPSQAETARPLAPCPGLARLPRCRLGSRIWVPDRRTPALHVPSALAKPTRQRAQRFPVPTSPGRFPEVPGRRALPVPKFGQELIRVPMGAFGASVAERPRDRGEPFWDRSAIAGLPRPPTAPVSPPRESRGDSHRARESTVPHVAGSGARQSSPPASSRQRCVHDSITETNYATLSNSMRDVLRVVTACADRGSVRVSTYQHSLETQDNPGVIPRRFCGPGPGPWPVKGKRRRVHG